MGLILGIKRPDRDIVPEHQFDQAVALFNSLTKGTHFTPLLPEFMCSLGFDPNLVNDRLKPEPLDFIIASGRFGQDPLLDDFANHLAAQGYSVAILNPVGTHADQQRRFVGLPLLTRPVNHFVILAQTQRQRGGSSQAVRYTLRTLDCKPVASQISHIDIVMPFYGGSRGHKLGQRKSLGYEVLEAPISADELSATIHEVERSWKRGRNKLKNPPTISVHTIDIHNHDKPSNSFKRHRVEFNSISPAPELANAIYQEIKHRGLSDLLIKVIIPDTGAIPRSENIVEHLLRHPKNNREYVDVVHIDKVRDENGDVDPVATKIGRVVRWQLDRSTNSITKTELPIPSRVHKDDTECIAVLTDDMGDGCTTSATDMGITSQHFSNIHLKIVAITHAVLSKGPQNLNSIGADVVIATNTLPTEDLSHENKITPAVNMESMAPTILRALTA